MVGFAALLNDYPFVNRFKVRLLLVERGCRYENEGGRIGYVGSDTSLEKGRIFR